MCIQLQHGGSSGIVIFVVVVDIGGGKIGRSIRVKAGYIGGQWHGFGDPVRVVVAMLTGQCCCCG